MVIVAALTTACGIELGGGCQLAWTGVCVSDHGFTKSLLFQGNIQVHGIKEMVTAPALALMRASSQTGH